MPGLHSLARAVAVLGLGAGAVVGLPGAASAATTITNAGGVLTIVATSAADVYVADGWEGDTLTVAGGQVTGCSGGDYYYDCAGVTRVVFWGSPQADVLLAVNASVPIEAHGGDGNDDLATGSGHDTVYGDGGTDIIGAGAGDDLVDGGDGNDDGQIRGDEGDDTVLGGNGRDRAIGGPGNDTVSGGPGNDELYGDFGGGGHWEDSDGYSGNDQIDGGDGNDLMHPQGGRDVVRGGAGADTATYDGFSDDGIDVAVALDRLPNDGPDGESDNVGPDGDVENVTGPDRAATVLLVGNGGPNVLAGESLSTLTQVDGSGGDDEISVHYADEAQVLGGAGDDEILVTSNEETAVLGEDGDDSIEGGRANDAFDGGDGDDELIGGAGNDVIDGGKGFDSILADADNDTVIADDGERDQVACGIGGDIATVDSVDVVNADPLEYCESLTVIRPSRPSVKVPTTRTLRVPATGKVKLMLRNTSSFKVSVAAVAKAKRKIGTGKATLRARAKGPITIKLTKAARKALKKSGKTKATITYTLRGNGQKVTVKRKVTLKPKR